MFTNKMIIKLTLWVIYHLIFECVFYILRTRLYLKLISIVYIRLYELWYWNWFVSIILPLARICHSSASKTLSYWFWGKNHHNRLHKLHHNLDLRHPNNSHFFKHQQTNCHHLSYSFILEAFYILLFVSFSDWLYH